MTRYKTTKKLNPGAPGTKKLVKKYGHNLISIRYKLDTLTNESVKTVELIEDEIINRKNKDRRVKISIGYEEKELRETVKQHGGKWNRDEKLWTISYSQAVKLKLKNRIIKNY